MRGIVFLVVFMSYNGSLAQSKCESKEATKVSLDGLKAFEAKEYEKALGYYDRLIEICPTADAYWARARCYEELGDIEKALESFKKVLESGPSEERRIKTEAKIREIEERMNMPVKITFRCNPEDTIIKIDGGEEGDCKGRYDLRPGRHIIEARKIGYEMEIREVEVERMKDTEVIISLRKTESPLMVKDTKEGLGTPIYKKWWFWSGVGGALAVGGIVTSVIILKAKEGGSSIGKHYGDVIFR